MTKAGPSFASPGAGVPAINRAELQKDAETAWQFFAAMTPGTKKGVVPAAVWRQDGGYGSYDILTMWDAGSIILAYVSARSIGLIDAKEFDERISNVMAFLKAAEFRWGKGVLPNYRTSVTNYKAVEVGYDSTDTGRLFVALHILDKVTNGAYAADKLIAHWNLPDIVQNKALYDIKGSKRIKSECYNYVFYISRGHKLWNIDVATGYEQPLDPADDASRKAFLAHVAKIGSIASEPSVNEAIELGHSTHSKVLANVLYAAQKERFDKTGVLTCVSEAPIDKNPWFTYQGYDLTAEGWHRWPVHSSVTAKHWQTKSFADAYRMVSTKGAFMWHAENGDDYSRKLIEHVRAKARTEGRGFGPGVFEANGKRPNIMDVNTNGMVLEAIASIFSGRKPLVELKI
ncbi:MAG: DUF3131 domain-containing protein [Hyphomicrobiaceae bacterium]